MSALRAAAVAFLLAWAAPVGLARADLFSPGPLSRAHEKLEGLSNCTQCHVAGSKLSESRCLDCHTELKDRVARGTGFHGRMKPDERACQTCHHEHQGRDAVQIDWGPAGRKGFEHKRTGFVLVGKHARVTCEQCHDAKLVADPQLRALRAEQPKRTTFLGAPKTCGACHFDEHRGQLGGECQQCHSEQGWKPAAGFSHAKAAFQLAGKHVQVECGKCHARVLDTEEHRDAALKPQREVFSRYKPVAHTACTDCHKDPHEGRFGEACDQCHSPEDWRKVKGAGEVPRGGGARAFHDQTRFPLRGAHADVGCKACHGPSPAQKAVFKGLAFASCTDCHVDAHLGQLGALDKPGAACDRCHTLDGFRPVRYEVKDHRGWPLEGAHAAVACARCHKQDPKLQTRAAPIRTWLSRHARADVLSLAQLHPPSPPGRCDSCHADPHGGQFATRVKAAGCSDCHTTAAFAPARFDHSSFPLDGAHAKAACARCHPADASGVVAYRGLDHACAACHTDPHGGQFADASGTADCARCHTTQAYKPSTFVHRPPATDFELRGKHDGLACAACHKPVQVAPGVQLVRYVGLPKTCAGCHVDAHRGAFRELSR